jgi:hypothetical protein
MSWTEIAMGAAELIAKQQGCELASFSIDDVDVYTGADGTEIVAVRASCKVTRAEDHDTIPWEHEVAEASSG